MRLRTHHARALVIGGYGNFGAAICRRLVQMPEVTVVVAGRSADKAAAFAATLQAESLPLDADDPALADRLCAARCDIVVSTAGPFQGADYRVAHAAMAAGAHYIDIADGRDFVCGIGALDAAARARDVLVVSGASSVPALSSAVVDELCRDVPEPTRIAIGISASGRLPGAATLQAVLSYCGQPIRQWDGRRWIEVTGGQGLTRRRFGAPVDRRWLVNCDVPDLALLPERYASRPAVTFQAGSVLRSAMAGAWMFAAMVKRGWMSSASSRITRLARGAQRLSSRNACSGMFVDVDGRAADGSERSARWELIAHANHGAEIPCMGAVAMVRGLVQGRITARGAHACVGFITLADYLAELAHLDIETRDAGPRDSMDGDAAPGDAGRDDRQTI